MAFKVDGGRVALNIKDPATHDLARRLAAATGRSMTEAVRAAIEESLARAERSAAGSDEAGLVARLDAIARHCAALPVRRQRSEDDILGYDERGLPGAW
jgi:antitoxin VapB